MQFITTLKIKLFADFIGKDHLGNQYYESDDAGDALGRKRRYVIYANSCAQDGSGVPPLWHGWLHHMIKNAPQVGEDKELYWRQPHRPNATGTKYAHNPEANFQEQDENDKKYYQPWNPKESS